MTEAKSSNLPLIGMILVYMLCALGAFGHFFMGLLFGSEVYRDRGIPLAEWVLIAGPLMVIGAMLAATIMLWNKGHRRIAYGLFALLLLGLIVVFPSIMGFAV